MDVSILGAPISESEKPATDRGPEFEKIDGEYRGTLHLRSGDWIFGLLVSAVYGEHVRGTIVAYPTNGMPISLGQDLWRRSFPCSSPRE
jgi:hypothetical protein